MASTSHCFNRYSVLNIQMNLCVFLMSTKWKMLSVMCNIFLQYRKVASSRPVYYSIFEHFWGATNQGSLYRRAAIQFLNFVGGVTNRDVLLLATLRYASSDTKTFCYFFFIDVGYTYNLELISEKSPFST